MVGNTLRNISKGASNIASTSAAFGVGVNALLSRSMPSTGTTAIPIYEKTGAKNQSFKS